MKETRGLSAKTRDGGLIFKKPRVSLTKRPCEGVRGVLSHPSDRRLTGEINPERGYQKGQGCQRRWGGAG
jgi:hypothetical protein